MFARLMGYLLCSIGIFAIGTVMVSTLQSEFSSLIEHRMLTICVGFSAMCLGFFVLVLKKLGEVEEILTDIAVDISANSSQLTRIARLLQPLSSLPLGDDSNSEEIVDLGFEGVDWGGPFIIDEDILKDADLPPEIPDGSSKSDSDGWSDSDKESWL